LARYRPKSLTYLLTYLQINSNLFNGLDIIKVEIALTNYRQSPCEGGLDCKATAKIAKTTRLPLPDWHHAAKFAGQTR